VFLHNSPVPKHATCRLSPAWTKLTANSPGDVKCSLWNAG